ncbi:MAG: UDP-N-acetylmuramoyl-L-alanyl-D-glutamate--2,6-diaminopimelate ligase [Clostridiales bacterium]|nr:UDP-N-acetylmuramoyl-L-alanyl-D-glutamate--2,6-diaminopimelate ligase [Clostridiales bacterium]
MKLKDIISPFSVNSGLSGDEEITFITDNSKKIQPGSLFLCIKGRHFDGHDAAAGALENGAAAVVCERDMGLEKQIIVPDSRSAYTRFCAAFYSHPEKKLKLIGITGTNGKTTSAFVIKDIIESFGMECGLIGTVKNCVGKGIEYGASLTTPDPYELFSLFSQMAENGCEYCVMEVSSQALDQKRVEGLHFDASLFTNLTRDHLDYHGSFEDYMSAKHLLFENADIAVVNGDDAHSGYMMQSTNCRNVTFGKADKNDYKATEVEMASNGVSYTFCSDNNSEKVFFGVPGNFSVYNSMGAAALLCEIGFDFKAVANALKLCGGVPGRMEVVRTDTPFTVIIDYAHTPDGLENLLKSVRHFATGRVIAVFGCGGDRDRTKRPLMGRIGSEIADIAVITSDNPRTEDPEMIVSEVMQGVDTSKNEAIAICDRTQAIRKALQIAQKGDVVVLAGKGHETYQILREGKIHYDEREIVRDIIEGRI